MSDPTAAAPFHMKFDFNSDHCSWRLEDQIDLVPERFRAELTGLDVVDFHERLLAIVDDDTDEADREIPAPTDAERPGIADILDDLRSCAKYQCYCAQEAWDGEKDQINDSIAEIGGHRWALCVRGENDSPPYGTPDLDMIFGQFRSRDGYMSVEADWNGTRLDVTFGGEYGGKSTVTLTPLSREAEQAFDIWIDQSSFLDEGDAAAAVAAATPDAIRGAIALWHKLPGDLDLEHISFEEVLAYFGQHGALSDDEIYVVARLAAHWDGTVGDMIDAGRILQDA